MRAFQPVIDAIIQLAEKAAKEPFDFASPDHSVLLKSIQDIAGADLSAAYKIKEKADRYAAVGVAREKAKAALVKSEANPNGADALVFKEVFKEAEAKVVRGDIIRHRPCASTAARPTRSAPSSPTVCVLPRTHGSALFTRGETQALVRRHARHG